MNVSNKIRIKTACLFCFIFMAAFALSYAMYGTVLPHMISYYSINMQQASLLTVTENIGYIFAMILTIMVADRMEKSFLLGGFVLLYGLVMVLMGRAPAFIIFLGLRILLGMACSILDNVSTAYMSDLSGERRSRNIAILHMIYGIGSMLGPKYAALMLTGGFTWESAYFWFGLFMALVGIVFALVFIVIKPPKLADAKAPGITAAPAKLKKIPYLDMLKNKNMLILFITNLLFSAFSYYQQWLQTYLQQNDPAVYTIGFCSTIMTVYYVAMILSRLTYAAISDRIRSDKYIRAASLISGVLMFLILVINHPWIWVGGLFLIGFISGPSHTIRFVLACDEFPEYSATIVAFTAFFGAVGGILFSWLMGVAADNISYQAAMVLPVGALLLTYILFKFGYLYKIKNIA